MCPAGLQLIIFVIIGWHVEMLFGPWKREKLQNSSGSPQNV